MAKYYGVLSYACPLRNSYVVLDAPTLERAAERLVERFGDWAGSVYPAAVMEQENVQGHSQLQRFGLHELTREEEDQYRDQFDPPPIPLIG